MPKIFDRRTFVRLSAVSIGAAAFPELGCSRRGEPITPITPTTPTKAATPAKKAGAHRKVRRSAVLGTVIGPGRHDDPTGGARQRYLSLLDLDAPSATEPTRIKTSFFGHGVAIRPDKPWLAVVFEKKGKGCCEVDLVAAKVTRTIATTEERHFYGHGVFSADGKHLFCTEAVVGDGSYRGVIAVRRAHNYKLIGVLDSGGHAPHDLHLGDSGKVLVVTNGGGTLDSGHTPNLAFINLESRRVRERLPLDTPMVNAGHVAIGANGALTVVSAPRTGMTKTGAGFVGGVSFRAKDRLHTSSHDITKALRGEVLSVAIHRPTGIAATTCPDGGRLLFWDAGSGALLAEKAVEHVRGVSLSLDGQWFVVTHGKDALLSLYGTRTLTAPGKPRSSWMSGSHTIVRDLRAI